MMNNRRIFAIPTLGLRHVAVDDIRILTMRHDWQTGRREDMLQRFTTIYKHIPR